ncbi:MAG: bifunctional sugar-1-phosphate nucleotidylyltransferase/acetyltransferase [Candidatus Bathycorpusculaceae bacterium]
MRTVILAGGSGRRVFPLAAVKPKPMFKILGKPLIQHVIETLKEAGLRDFIVVIGKNGKQIKDYLADGKKLGVKIEYALQKKPLGMANALEAAKGLVEDNFFVVNADDVFESSLIKEMLKQFRKENAEIVLSCKTVEETWKFGIIQIKDNKVTRLVEKPPKGMEPSNLAVIGVYLMTKKIFSYFRKVPVSDHQYEDAIQKFIEDKNVVTAVSYEGFFASYKYPWDLFTINVHLMDEQIREKIVEDDVKISEGANVEGKVWIRRGTKIFGGASVKGPCYIGSNSVIGNNALVRDYSSIGDNCVVGFSSEIKHSLIGDNCWFHMNYIGDSIISDNCLFGAGAITANFRFDEKNVKVMVEGEKVDSGKNKLGAIVGDFCKVGINASLLPGVKIGSNSIVGAGVCLQEDLEPNKMIFLDKKCYLKRENKITVRSKSY